MYVIIEAESIAPDVRRIVVVASKIAKKHQAGQFVIVRVTPNGERIPLTIAESDPTAGSITMNPDGTVTVAPLRPGDRPYDNADERTGSR